MGRGTRRCAHDDMSQSRQGGMAGSRHSIRTGEVGWPAAIRDGRRRAATTLVTDKRPAHGYEKEYREAVAAR